ncbi:hypothetical protein ACTFIT_007656 [Dictyostelium discoideum]
MTIIIEHKSIDLKNDDSIIEINLKNITESDDNVGCANDDASTSNSNFNHNSISDESNNIIKNNETISNMEKCNSEKYKKNYDMFTNDWTYNQKIPGRPYYLFETDELSKFKKDKPWWKVVCTSSNHKSNNINVNNKNNNNNNEFNPKEVMYNK